MILLACRRYCGQGGQIGADSGTGCCLFPAVSPWRYLGGFAQFFLLAISFRDFLCCFNNVCSLPSTSSCRFQLSLLPGSFAFFSAFPLLWLLCFRPCPGPAGSSAGDSDFDAKLQQCG